MRYESVRYECIQTSNSQTDCTQQETVRCKAPTRKPLAQIYIAIDTKQKHVIVHGAASDGLASVKSVPLAKFYPAPTLAEAVTAAREFCRNYYFTTPAGEYNA